MLNKILFSGLMVLLLNQLFAQNLYDLENSTQFAKYLLRSKQYLLAAQEYERVIFLDPDNDSTKMLLIKAYRFSGDYYKSLERMEAFFPDPLIMPSIFAIGCV